MPVVTPSLTDRYVAAVIRRLPADQQDDVARELRATIEDTIDARHPGVDELAAERDALESLGDPARLAADYANTPGYLIGPAVYVDYVRLLRLLLAVVPTVVAVVTFGASLIGPGASVAGALRSLAGTWFMTAVQVAFWVTVAYAVIERSADPADRPVQRRWSIDRLDELLPAREFTLASTAAGVGFYGLLAAVLMALPTVATLAVGGAVVNVFHPGLWPLWSWYFVVVLGACMVLEVVKYRTGRWTPRLAHLNLALSLAFAGPVLGLLLTGRLLDSQGLAAAQTHFGFATGPSIAVLAVLIAGLTAWDVVDAYRRAARPARVAG